MRLSLLTLIAPVFGQDTWREWIKGFGVDAWQYPGWVADQAKACNCEVRDYSPPIKVECSSYEGGKWGSVQFHSTSPLSFCVLKQWLLDHMPEFDKNYLPPSVSVNGNSSLDDTVAFTLMADNSSAFSSNLPLQIKLRYLLPYASYHEARTNWRPLMFAKFKGLVDGSKSTVEAMTRLMSPAWSATQAPAVANWSAHVWDTYPAQRLGPILQWGSSTNPPVISPDDFTAYGYGSCTAWASLITYVARSVGIPARQVGTPCWNTGQFAGLSTSNPNVTQCWHGQGGGVTGGPYLNNHNWVEYWDDQTGKWVFVNVPPEDPTPNSGICTFSYDTGCDYNATTGCANSGSAGRTMQDHEIFAVTWTLSSEQDETLDGGPVVEAQNLKLSDGSAVSPLVWSPGFQSPIGGLMKNVGLRMINRTATYRCHAPGH